jgi:hypothetical protein
VTRLSWRRVARIVCRLAAVSALAAVAYPDVAAAEDRSSADVYLIVVGSDDVPAEFSQELGDVLASPPLALIHRVQVARADRVEAAELFDLHRTEAAHPTAWVIVDGATVHVRAAGAGRAQFVFRDITTSRPMTDLDRERVGQTLRTALGAVIEGRAGALDRAQAQQAVDFEEPRPTAPAREAPDVAPPLALIPPGSLPAGSEEPGPIQFRVGASLQIVRLHSQFAYAPGAIGSIEWRGRSFRPRVWLSVMDFLPHAYNGPPPAYAASFRGGVGATVPHIPWLQIDLGAGVDWLRGTAFPNGEGISVTRLAVRFGPTDRFGIRSSLTLSLEHVRIIFIDFFGEPLPGGDGTSPWRPGLTLELWWL